MEARSESRDRSHRRDSRMWRAASSASVTTPRSGPWPTAAEAARSRLFSRVAGRPAQARSIAPGCRRWCRGARAKTASSHRTCSTGTRASRAGGPARSSSKRPAFAMCRAARCCASGTSASCRACATSCAWCAKRATGRRGCFIQIIDFLTIRRRPDPARYFAQFLAITARHRAALGPVTMRRTMRCARGSPRCRASNSWQGARRRASSNRSTSATASA